MQRQLMPTMILTPVGLGQALYDLHPQVRKLYRQTEKVLGYSVLDLTQSELNQTRFVQPAIFVYSEACRRVLESNKKVSPRFFAGNSLGEYNALFAAGAFDLKDLLKLVQARAEGMQYASEVNPGGLAAFTVSVSETSSTKKAMRDFGGYQRYLTGKKGGLFLEGITSDTQVVLAGLDENLARAKKWFDEKGLRREGFRFVPLDVAGSFHTPFMEPATPFLQKALDEVYIRKTDVPVIANTTAKPISEPAEIRLELIEHLTKPVLWKNIIDFLEGEEVAATVELGKRPLLSKLMANRGRVAAAVGGATAIGVATFLYFNRKQK